jgi:hypothetical protein
MGSTSFFARIAQKRDTEANWYAANPVLLSGEVVSVDTEDGNIRFKVGDGTTPYLGLPYVRDLEVEQDVTDSTAWRPLALGAFSSTSDSKFSPSDTSGAVYTSSALKANGQGVVQGSQFIGAFQGDLEGTARTATEANHLIYGCITRNNDLDNCTEYNAYSFEDTSTVGATLKHSPTTENFVMFVLDGVQELFVQSSHTCYIRYSDGSAWGDWFQVYTAANLPSSVADISITGDITGDCEVQDRIANIETTLSATGVSAGTYGPGSSSTVYNSSSFSVPSVTVDTKGRITSASNRTITCKAFVVQSSTPSSTNVLWIDTGNSGILKYYNGSSWVGVCAVWAE